MTHATAPLYRCILVAVDGSATAELAFSHALQLAKHHRARLHVVHVVEAYRCAESFAGPGESDVSAALNALRHDGRRLLAEAKAKAAGAGVHVETALLQTHAQTEQIGHLVECSGDVGVGGWHAQSCADGQRQVIAKCWRTAAGAD